jgi:hypothetical protein
MLGDIGRLYSELAASWMWVAALGGIALWCYTRPKRRINNRFQNRRRVRDAGLEPAGWNAAVLRNRPDLVPVGWRNVDKLRAEMNWLTRR